jgi:hypothetical protein
MMPPYMAFAYAFAASAMPPLFHYFISTPPPPRRRRYYYCRIAADYFATLLLPLSPLRRCFLPLFCHYAAMLPHCHYDVAAAIADTLISRFIRASRRFQLSRHFLGWLSPMPPFIIFTIRRHASFLRH